MEANQVHKTIFKSPDNPVQPSISSEEKSSETTDDSPVLKGLKILLLATIIYLVGMTVFATFAYFNPDTISLFD